MPVTPGGSLFVWGYAPMFYYYSGLPPASRFVVMAQSRLTGYVSGNLGVSRDGQGIVPEHWDWLMADLESARATYILDTEPAGIFRWDRYPVRDFPRLATYLDRHYERLDEVDDVVIHRRRGCAGSRRGPEPPGPGAILAAMAGLTRNPSRRRRGWVLGGAAVYALLLMINPVLHDDLAGHLKSPMQCKACTASPSASRVEGVGPILPVLADAGWRWSPSAATVVIAGAIPALPGRSPPRLSPVASARVRACPLASSGPPS